MPTCLNRDRDRDNRNIFHTRGENLTVKFKFLNLTGRLTLENRQVYNFHNQAKPTPIAGYCCRLVMKILIRRLPTKPSMQAQNERLPSYGHGFTFVGSSVFCSGMGRDSVAEVDCGENFEMGDGAGGDGVADSVLTGMAFV